MKPHHVAFLIPGIDRIGGAERQVMTIAQGLAHRGWRTTMVALTGSGGPAAQELRRAGVDFFSLQMRKGIADPRGWLSLLDWIKTETPDVLHAHLPHATWMARGIRLIAPVRVVLDTIHTSATGTHSRRLAYASTAWLSDRVTTVSYAAADAFTHARMIRPERLTVLPNGIDVQQWQPDRASRAHLRHDFGMENDFIWFTAGRLEHVKDYPTMILAFAGVADSARLVIAGTGSQEGALRKLVNALQINHRVLFLGFQPDVRRWLQAADGFLLSSLWEGLPISLLEAGACALPCVATNVPGTCEVVFHDQTGFLARPEDPARLRDAMLRLMHLPPGTRQAMRQRARERITTLFNLESVLDRWDALYRDLLQGNPSPRRLAGKIPAIMNHPASPSEPERAPIASTPPVSARRH